MAGTRPTPHPVATAEPPGEADAVVVGGGYCGLSAATELAHRGRSRRGARRPRPRLGGQHPQRRDGAPGAEGRARAPLERTHGELGLRLHAEVEAAFDHVEKVIADGAIDCAYERTGQLYVSHSRARRAPTSTTLAGELTSVGSPAHVVRGDDLAAEIGSDRSPPGSWWSAAAASTRPASMPA